MPRRLGRTQLSLPAFGLGCAPLGELYAPIPEAVARETLCAAWDGGIRYYDTSPWYGRGLSELRLGQLLRRKPRREFLISTKIGRTFHRPRDPDNFVGDFWQGGSPFEQRFDYTYDGVMRSYEQSMMRTGLNRFDLLLIHDLDIAEMGSGDLVAHHFRDLERSGWRALEMLRREGEIEGVGAGVNILGTIPEMLKRFDLDAFLVAMPYNLLDQRPLDAEFPLCAERSAGIIIGSPFASGILATGSKAQKPLFNYAPAHPEIIAKVRSIEVVCARYDISLKAAAMQFPLRHPLVASVIFGAIGRSQALENMALFSCPIPEAFWQELRDLSLIHPLSP
ncbi:aldo/keto reductase [Taklimakanibacter deserti]|uniref:aldo/keto reductase n=1 Tax=Taklimakanibacter deserti TaxID=2267839 RepID=UPI000E65BF70